MNQDKNTAGTTSDTFSKDRLKSEAEAGKGKLAELAESAASAGKAQLDSGLGQAAGQVEEVARVIDETASRLRSENHEGLAAYASQVAGSIENVANRLRNSSVDELATEARQLARSNPALFLMGSVVVGFGLTRFLKASSRIQDYDRMSDGQARRDVYGSSYGDSRDPTHDWDSGTGGRSQGGLDAGSRSSSGASGDSSHRGTSGGMGGSSGGMGGSTSGGLSGSSGMGGSTGSSSGASGSSGGLGGSTGAGSGLGTGSTTSGGSTSGGSTSGASASGTRAGTDTFDELRSKPVFPEMKTEGLSAGGTVGGTRTNQVSGGSNG